MGYFPPPEAWCTCASCVEGFGSCGPEWQRIASGEHYCAQDPVSTTAAAAVFGSEVQFNVWEYAGGGGSSGFRSSMFETQFQEMQNALVGTGASKEARNTPFCL